MNPKRRVGTTSRVRRCPGLRHPWASPGGHTVDLPVVVDIMHVDPESLTVMWSVEARVDLIDDFPAIIDVRVKASGGLHHASMQAKFRWATPLDVVAQTMPELLSLGIDPFSYSYPLSGFPAAAYVERAVPTRLTDSFLEAIVARYLALGRGYAKAIAVERNVSPRTVVSWIEKARARGILTATTPGSFGGKLASGPRARAR